MHVIVTVSLYLAVERNCISCYFINQAQWYQGHLGSWGNFLDPKVILHCTIFQQIQFHKLFCVAPQDLSCFSAPVSSLVGYSTFSLLLVSWTKKEVTNINIWQLNCLSNFVVDVLCSYNILNLQHDCDNCKDGQGLTVLHPFDLYCICIYNVEILMYDCTLPL